MQENLPNHIGIIMDGNGRYAQNHHRSRSWGHKKGAENLKKLCKHIFNKGIKYLSIYAFSTENFKRPKEEVDYLMNLFVQMFTKDFQFLQKENVKVIFSGRKENLPADVVDSCNKMSIETKNNQKAVLNVCLNYGSQDEIVDTMKKIAVQLEEKKIIINDITKELIEENLYNNLPPLDLVIRTSGEERLSNFMLWQASYAEFYFPKCHFPEFTKEEFDKALAVYQKRNRRFGGLK